MKKNFIFMMMSLGILFCSCQKEENWINHENETGISGLAKEYGFTYSEADKNVQPDFVMSIEELKIFLENFKQLEGKTLKLTVNELPIFTKGVVTSDEPFIYYMEESVNNLGIKIAIIYYQKDKNFDVTITDLKTHEVKHRSTSNTNVVFNMYGNVPYVSLIKTNIVIKILSNGNLIDFRFKLQVDWDYIYNPQVANFNLETWF